MLKNTFMHVPGVGPGTEQKLWQRGITDWDALARYCAEETPTAKEQKIGRHIRTSRTHFDAGDPAYFANALPSGQHWRFFPEFRDSTVYLDIETNGLDVCFGEITTIAMYDGHSVFTYVNGQNLQAFKEDIKRYKVIVSYNGKCFDVPFIQDYFGIRLDQAHIDLRYVLAALGYKGGLKRCEKALGIDRGDLDGVDGYFAVLLWNEYRRTGDLKALETLLAYNAADVVNLESLMVMAYNLSLADTPFPASRQLPLPALPEPSFAADRQTVERIKMRSGFGF